MRLKPGVRCSGLQPPILLAMVIAESTVQRIANIELVVTSLTDGQHKPGSLHHCGLAFDFRTSTMSEEQKAAVQAALAVDLGGDFDVVLEATHCHVEYDPK